MNEKYFIELTGYMIWVNQKIRTWLTQISEAQWTQTIPSSFSSVRQTALHLVSAERIWLDFWQEVPNPTFLSQEFQGSKDELMQVWENTSANLLALIQNYPEEDYSQTIRFRVRGEAWQMQFWQTFSHFINHATYHRGQLVTLLRQVGFSNFTSTDLATYYQLNLREESSPVIC